VFTGYDLSSATETQVEHILPTTQTFTKLYCWAAKPSGADVFTVRVKGVSQTGTCTIPTNGETVVSASVNITINAGELFDVQLAQAGSAVAATWTLTQ